MDVGTYYIGGYSIMAIGDYYINGFWWIFY